MKKQSICVVLSLLCLTATAFSQEQTQKQLHIYEGLSFGTTKSEYYKQFPRARVVINNYKYTFHPKFYRDSILTSLVIATDTMGADSFKRVEMAMYNLSDLYTREFDKPGLYNKNIGPNKVLKGRFVLLTFWNIGPKYVPITLYRTKEDMYYATCRLENKAFEESLAEASAKKN
jgi:hypothetical protein